MRTAAAIVAFVALGCGPSATPPSTATAAQRPLEADGGPLALDQAPAPLLADGPEFADVVRGRVVLVDFWASWCAPCRESVPALIRLHDAYHARGFTVVGVDVGEAPEKARRFVAEAGIDYPVFADPQFAFCDAMKAKEVPTLLLVGRDGTVRARHAGLDADVLVEVRTLLQEPPPS